MRFFIMFFIVLSSTLPILFQNCSQQQSFSNSESSNETEGQTLASTEGYGDGIPFQGKGYVAISENNCPDQTRVLSRILRENREYFLTRWECESIEPQRIPAQDILVKNETEISYQDINYLEEQFVDPRWLEPLPEGDIPSIEIQPQSQNLDEGDQLELSVVASGENLAYQWLKSGNIVVGATQEQLIIESVEPNNQGDYFVMITNPSGWIISETVRVNVTAAPEPTPTPKVYVGYQGCIEIGTDRGLTLFDAQRGGCPGNADAAHNECVVNRMDNMGQDFRTANAGC